MAGMRLWDYQADGGGEAFLQGYWGIKGRKFE
jgi:hypothetical protein